MSITGGVEVATTRRTTLTKDELAVWRDYIETAEALRTRLASRMQDESSLSMGDYAVLLALSEADEHRVRSSELADRVGWERSRLSHHLGRMERRDLIRRDPCASDSRGAEVVLTEAGAAAFRHGSVPHLKAVRELFIDAFTPAQLAEIALQTARLRDHLDSGEMTDS
ncbi:MarR family winged helix-turn-helix transcriptional regulator [Gryllotalpicola reticulitermitis]|uniref:MarR family winged helix-turn-helix transcriptional regulator n=1 Tax=Gryllotalpicola reticulitermitis TaxID=1184153 RepID=A0ABV8Q917_9MICO